MDLDFDPRVVCPSMKNPPHPEIQIFRAENRNPDELEVQLVTDAQVGVCDARHVYRRERRHVGSCQVDQFPETRRLNFGRQNILVVATYVIESQGPGSPGLQNTVDRIVD